MPQPYNITNEKGIAYFTAENQAIYKALFLQVSFSGEPQLEGFIVDFSFERDISNCPDTKCKARDGSYRKKVGNKDERIQLTVKEIITEFFLTNPFHIVYFTCDSTDNKHKGRLQMFDDWYQDHRQLFTKIPFLIPGYIMEGEVIPDTVGAAIFLKAHPHHALASNFVNSEVMVYNSIKVGF